MTKRERLASLGEVAAQIAHEIRNPLAAMMSSLELLRSKQGQELTASDTMQYRLIDIIERETQRVDGLIDSFLRFSRPPKPHPHLFSLNELVSELILMQPDQLINLLEDEVQLFADSDQVRQIYGMQQCLGSGESTR